MEMSSIKKLMPHNPDQTLDKAILACGGSDVGGQEWASNPLTHHHHPLGI